MGELDLKDVLLSIIDAIRRTQDPNFDLPKYYEAMQHLERVRRVVEGIKEGE